MSNIVLYQTGNRSRDPKNGTYYDPWENHIWLCIEQIRKWNPYINIYLITDDCDIKQKDNFEVFKVNREFIEKLETRFDVDGLDYFRDSLNPSERACGLRPFYIESVIKKYNLKNVFSFDNDVLIYCDLNEISKIIEEKYERIGLTPDSKDRMVLGMCYIKNLDAITDINNYLWEYMNDNKKKYLIDMALWNFVYSEMGKSYIDVLPTWVDGLFSGNHQEIGGIFDPSSIGQFLLGCDNGNPPGTLFYDHYIHNRLSEKVYEFKFNFDGDKKYLQVLNKKLGLESKILSIHVHNKKLKLLM